MSNDANIAELVDGIAALRETKHRLTIKLIAIQNAIQETDAASIQSAHKLSAICKKIAEERKLQDKFVVDVHNKWYLVENNGTGEYHVSPIRVVHYV